MLLPASPLSPAHYPSTTDSHHDHPSREPYLHDLILQLRQEEVHDLVLLDRQRVQIDLLHALDLASLDQSSKLRHRLPFLLVALVAASTAAATSTSATAIAPLSPREPKPPLAPPAPPLAPPAPPRSAMILLVCVWESDECTRWACEANLWLQCAIEMRFRERFGKIWKCVGIAVEECLRPHFLPLMGRGAGGDVARRDSFTRSFSECLLCVNSQTTPSRVSTLSSNMACVLKPLHGQ